MSYYLSTRSFSSSRSLAAQCTSNFRLNSKKDSNKLPSLQKPIFYTRIYNQPQIHQTTSFLKNISIIYRSNLKPNSCQNYFLSLSSKTRMRFWKNNWYNSISSCNFMTWSWDLRTQILIFRTICLWLIIKIRTFLLMYKMPYLQWRMKSNQQLKKRQLDILKMFSIIFLSSRNF